MDKTKFYLIIIWQSFQKVIVSLLYSNNDDILNILQTNNKKIL